MKTTEKKDSPPAEGETIYIDINEDGELGNYQSDCSDITEGSRVAVFKFAGYAVIKKPVIVEMENLLGSSRGDLK